MAILGLSTNTRLLGLAIINQGELSDFSMHLHKSSWSASKANKIITSLEPCVQKYCITSVVLSIPYAHHQTKAFTYLISRIQKYFKAKNIPVYTKTTHTLYSVFAPQQKKTKKELMHSLCAKYPPLMDCLQKELRNKSKYYIKVFEAAAVASLLDQKDK